MLEESEYLEEIVPELMKFVVGEDRDTAMSLLFSIMANVVDEHKIPLDEMIETTKEVYDVVGGIARYGD